MSDLFRQTIPQGPPSKSTSRPFPVPYTSDIDDHSSSSSSSSDSSASSAASAATLRPSSREQPLVVPAPPWKTYFDQELYLPQTTPTQKALYHVYLTPPQNPSKGPLFICHHGAGASALSFATFALSLRNLLPAAGILSLSARGHGSLITDPVTNAEILDYSLAALTHDAMEMILVTTKSQSWPQIPPTILLGHSLGGAVLTTLATTHFRTFGSNLIGYAVLDVVEGSAIEALGLMKTYLSSRPQTFPSVEEAINWHVRSRTIRSQKSAEASVPSLLVEREGSFTWRTDLAATNPWWEEWFKGMSQKFLTGRGAKLLILAGTDRLDRELMIGQMQGKFQLVVIPEAGHFVHEDVAEKTAGLLVEFFKRNDRSQMVLPPKVSELLAQGKKA